jgi:hypothetical protein
VPDATVELPPVPPFPPAVVPAVPALPTVTDKVFPGVKLVKYEIAVPPPPPPPHPAAEVDVPPPPPPPPTTVTLSVVTPVGIVNVPLDVKTWPLVPPAISLVKATVPVESGNVRVWLLLEFGDATVNMPVPPTFPERRTELMFAP